MRKKILIFVFSSLLIQSVYGVNPEEDAEGQEEQRHALQQLGDEGVDRKLAQELLQLAQERQQLEQDLLQLAQQLKELEQERLQLAQKQRQLAQERHSLELERQRLEREQEEDDDERKRKKPKN